VEAYPKISRHLGADNRSSLAWPARIENYRQRDHAAILGDCLTVMRTMLTSGIEIAVLSPPDNFGKPYNNDKFASALELLNASQ
jgi:hypothetical protein